MSFPFVKVMRDVWSTQAYGCLLCIQIGSTAYLLGKKKGFGTRIEILTPGRKWRFSPGTRDKE